MQAVVPDSKKESIEVVRKTGLHTPYSIPVFKEADGRPLKSKIYSVPGFGRTFPDLQDVHIVAARKWGVSPVEDREEAEMRKDGQQSLLHDGQADVLFHPLSGASGQ